MITALMRRVGNWVERVPGGMQALDVTRRLRGSSFFVNLFSTGLATAFAKIMNVVLLGYAARTLGPENYGLVGWGVSIAAYASIFISPGLVTWGARAVAYDRPHAGRTLVIVNLTQIVLACLGYGLLVLFAWQFATSPAQRTIVLLSGLVLFNQALSADWIFRGLELARIPANLSIITTVINAMGLFALIHAPADVFVYVAIGLVANLITILTGYGILLGQFRFRLALPARLEFRQALISSLPLGVALAVVIILHYANNLIVQAYLGTAALGVFMAAFRLLEQATTIPGILGIVFLPRLARIVKSGEARAQQEALVFARVHLLAAFFVAGFFLAEAPAIVRVLYGPAYAQTVDLLRILAVAVIFNYAICGYTNCLISFGKDRVMVLVVIVSAVVSVGGGLLLVPWLGTLGAAIVVACIDLAGWLISLPYYRRAVGTLQLKAWVNPLLGGAGIVLVSVGLQAVGAPLWLRIPSATLVYLPFIYKDVKGSLL